jgi:dihydroneopterin aldolase
MACIVKEAGWTSFSSTTCGSRPTSASSNARKAAPQTLEISLTFGVPDAAAQNDDIEQTIRYDAVIDRIRAELAARHFNLLETLGEYVIGLLLDEFGAPWVKISIAKMGIMKGVRRVGVQIERSR